MTTHPRDHAAPARRRSPAPAGAAPTSPFYDHQFANNNKPDPHPWHITGACQAAYARGCRCDDCRQAWREGSRRRSSRKPSPLALEVERLTLELDTTERELDAAEMHNAALEEENMMLRCRLQELDQ